MGDENAAKPYRYKLTLEVEENGAKRSFSSSDGFARQGEMSGALACDIARMFGILDDPPADGELVGAMNDDYRSSPLAFVAMLQERTWAGICNFHECVTVGVDVSRMCEGEGGLAGAARLMIGRAPFAREIGAGATKEG